MNLDLEKERDLLAGEYVLGTLSAAESLELERASLRDPKLAQAISSWEEKFVPLFELLPPQKPATRVWQEIQASLEREKLALRFAEKKSLWSNLRFWRPLALLGSALAVIFCLLWASPTFFGEKVSHVALLRDTSAKQGWNLLFFAKSARIEVQNFSKNPLEAGKDFELWVLPMGQDPISLGLLPAQGEKTIRLSEAQKAVLSHAQGFAVSLEPSGGSPTGKPTGPVLYQASLVSIL